MWTPDFHPTPTQVRGKHPAPASARACHRQPATTEGLRPREYYENSKHSAETPYLFLKYFGQGGAVRQFNEPHHVSHRPLQRVALQNQSPLLLLFYFLQRKRSSRSFHHRMVGRVLSKALWAGARLLGPWGPPPTGFSGGTCSSQSLGTFSAACLGFMTFVRWCVHLEVKIQGMVIAAVESQVQEILGLCISYAALTEGDRNGEGCMQTFAGEPAIPTLIPVMVVDGASDLAAIT